ncbi:protein 2 in picA locus, putative [Entamoeba invadens IP1]|uniref:Protein 2 in picA locus, putative n=1 Tax=Entamoeba invadens IP1 TaxID=370355 RepID=A0A0A1TUB9_ENTIV|nr:protein 2 in picA locus, putative [Entamoeba invadens IP1]ELP83544.1 protein 2 in picA locus, putative [Entamoeba invadens IP1]|eukprot:XP_004182890.1 protein 2 in picA locus, putative [Entamoeba invadens IP1]
MHSHLVTNPQPPHHFKNLNILRGVASFIVVVFHLFETYSTSLLDQRINHGYLAVDFFFMVSGFVLSYSNSKSTSNSTSPISFQLFMTKRYIRLQPFQLFGTLIGLLTFYCCQSPVFPLVEKTSVIKLLFVFLITVLMIPVPPSLDIFGDGAMYPLNGPMWTSFFEYCGSAFYFCVLRKLNKTKLFILCVVFSFLLMDIATELNVFGMMEKRERYGYSLVGGWVINTSHLYIGFSRLLFPFTMGVFLDKMKQKIDTHFGEEISVFLLLFVFFTPRIGGANYGWENGVFEVFCVVFVFPVIILIAIGSPTKNRKTEKVAQFFGNISYGMFCVNYPLIYLQMVWAQKYSELPSIVHLGFGSILLCLCIILSVIGLRWFDEPLRTKLNKLIKI